MTPGAIDALEYQHWLGLAAACDQHVAEMDEQRSKRNRGGPVGRRGRR